MFYRIRKGRKEGKMDEGCKERKRKIQGRQGTVMEGWKKVRTE